MSAVDRWLIAWIVFSQAAGIAITWWQRRKMTALTRHQEAERTARHAEEMRRLSE